jgi:hypothetical protein
VKVRVKPGIGLKSGPPTVGVGFFGSNVNVLGAARSVGLVEGTVESAPSSPPQHTHTHTHTHTIKMKKNKKMKKNMYI